MRPKRVACNLDFVKDDMPKWQTIFNCLFLPKFLLLLHNYLHLFVSDLNLPLICKFRLSQILTEFLLVSSKKVRLIFTCKPFSLGHELVDRVEAASWFCCALGREQGLGPTPWSVAERQKKFVGMYWNFCIHFQKY